MLSNKQLFLLLLCGISVGACLAYEINKTLMSDTSVKAEPKMIECVVSMQVNPRETHEYRGKVK